MTLSATFQDSGRTAQNAPDPKYPDGMRIDMSNGQKACEIALQYPAPRCGIMLIECDTCGLRVAVTVAGRPDDPRTVKVACKTN